MIHLNSELRFGITMNMRSNYNEECCQTHDDVVSEGYKKHECEVGEDSSEIRPGKGCYHDIVRMSQRNLHSTPGLPDYGDTPDKTVEK